MDMKFNRRFFGEREFFIGLFSIAAGVFLFLERDKNPELYQIYPRFVFSALVAVGVIMVIKALAQPEEKNQKGAGVTALEIVILLLVLAVRPVMAWLGIYSTLFLACMAVGVLLEKERTLKNLGALVCYNLILTAVLYVAFTVLLRVNMPKGLLF